MVICCALVFIGAEVKAQEYTFDNEEPVIKNTKTSSRRFIGIAPIHAWSNLWENSDRLIGFEVYYTDRFNKWLGLEMGVNHSGGSIEHYNYIENMIHVQLQVSSKYFTLGAGPSYCHESYYGYQGFNTKRDYFGVVVGIKIHPLIFNIGESNNRVGLGYRFGYYDNGRRCINTIFLFWEIGMPKIKNIFKGNEW